jgi:hypothetical protein
MNKKKLIIVSVLAVALMLTVGLVGSAVYASSTTSTDTPANPRMVLADKVAEILNLDTSTVEAAFTQAQKEIREEAQDNQLQKLVDDGKITQEQADQYKTWLESKPDVNIFGLDGGHSGMGPGGMGGHGAPPAQSGDTASSNN